LTLLFSRFKESKAKNVEGGEGDENKNEDATGGEAAKTEDPFFDIAEPTSSDTSTDEEGDLAGEETTRLPGKDTTADLYSKAYDDAGAAEKVAVNVIKTNDDEDDSPDEESDDLSTGAPGVPFRGTIEDLREPEAEAAESSGDRRAEVRQILAFFCSDASVERVL
jgi:hypothetical protein